VIVTVTGVGRRPDVAQHAEVVEGEHRHLRVDDGGGHRPRAHHAAPGCCRARLCISASTCPSASVCTPCLPPRPPIVPGSGARRAGERGRREHLVEDGVDGAARLRRVGRHTGQPSFDSDVRNSSST
jgi:hypothetical protein